MPIQPIPINGPPYLNADVAALPDQLGAELHDGYIDELGMTNMRPGLTDWVNTGTGLPVDGLHWWDEQNVLIGASNGSVFKVTDAAGTIVNTTNANNELSNDLSVIGNAGTRPIFAAATDGNLYATNGEKILYVQPVAGTALITDADAPLNASHVAFLDGYILANNANSGKFFWSNVNAPTLWTAADFATAEGEPDILVAIGIAHGEIFMLGRRSIESWYNDGTTPFRKLDGTFINMGTRSPYTLKFLNNTWYWLNENRQLVRMEGRSPKVVSGPFQKEIDGISDVGNAIGDIANVAGQNFYILTFPETDRTYVYNYAKNEWQGRWNVFDQNDNAYHRWRGASVAWCPAWNIWAVGDKANGKIYKMERTQFQDNGVPIHTKRVTGNITHGTMRPKRSNEIVFRFKRGSGAVASPVVRVRWANDGKPFGAWHDLELGSAGDTRSYARLHRCGVYRTRQYEILHSANTDFVLVGAEEDVDILRAGV